MVVGPWVSRTSASWPTGSMPPFIVGTRISEAIDRGSERKSRG
jgi:hypothetical protein